jgi:hypothetical protein
MATKRLDIGGDTPIKVTTAAMALMIELRVAAEEMGITGAVVTFEPLNSAHCLPVFDVTLKE